MVNMLVAFAEEATWNISILDIQESEELVSEEIVTLYTGDTQTVIYSDSPENEEEKYLLINLSVDKVGTEISTFNISSIALQIDEVIYAQSDNSMVEQHDMVAFTQNDITFGGYEGYIVFEIPSEADLTSAVLDFDGEAMELKVTATGSESLTNIGITENIVDTQWELEMDIIDAYYVEEHTVENPYVVLDPYQWSPLTALVMFETEEEAKIEVEVVGKDEYSTIINEYDTYNTHHEVPILGLYADYNNTVNLVVTYADGTVDEITVYIETEELKDNNDMLEITLVESNPEEMQEGLTFLEPTGASKYPMAVDCNGDVRWILYSAASQITKRINNGNIIVLKEGKEYFMEMDLLGKVYSQYNDLEEAHHDIIQLPNDNFLTTSSTESNYLEDGIVELDVETGDVVNLIDLKDVIDTSRFNESDSTDWIHLNSLWYDESDESLVVSGRHQGVFKISYPDGELQWILTIGEELEGLEDAYLTPIGEDFKVPVSQHATMIMPDQDDNPDTVDIMLFDNNISYNDMPVLEDDQQYSRLVQYRIDEVNMTVEEIWSYGEELGYEYFGDIVGDADYLENGNVLGTFGRRKYMLSLTDNVADTGTVIEINKETDEVVYEIDVQSKDGEAIYRSERLTLYPDEWDYALLSEKGEIKAKNNYDLYQYDNEILEIDLDEIINSDEVEGTLSAQFKDTYSILEITGYCVIEGMDSNTYEMQLIFSSEDTTKSIVLNQNDSIEKGEAFNETFGDDIYYNMCRFDVLLTYEELQEQFPAGQYQIGVLIQSGDTVAYTGFDKYFTVEEETTQIETDDYMTEQQTVTENLEQEFIGGSYTMETPFVVLDPYDVSPLTALIGFTTDEEGSVEIEIAGKDEYTTLNYSFEESTTTHLLPIYGLYADTNNEVIIRFTSVNGELTEQVIEIQTSSLPSDMAVVEVEVADTEKMADGFTFATSNYAMAYDANGDVRWYLDSGYTKTAVSPINRLENGNIILSTGKLIESPYYSTGFYELDMMGRIYTEFCVDGLHHDIQELENGDFMVFAEAEGDTVEDHIVLIDRTTGEVKNSWDMGEILGIEMIEDETYESLTIDSARSNNPNATEEEVLEIAMESSTEDWFHANSFDYNEEDDTITVSGRMKDMVVNFNAEDGEINWILSDPTATWAEELADKILEPMGDDFEYQYGQHAVCMLEDGDLLLYDNGNFKTKDPDESIDVADNYSRIVRYEIDTENMTVEQVFEYGSERNELFTPYIGDVDYLGENHYLVNFGGIVLDGDGNNMETTSSLFSGDNASGEAVIIEILDDEVVNETRLNGVVTANTYRAERLTIYSDSQGYIDLSVDGILVNGVAETEHVTDVSLPEESEAVVFTLDTAINEGNRVLLGMNYINFVDDDTETYIVLESSDETRIYAAEDGVEMYINKSGLFDGKYVIGALVVTGDGESYYTKTNQYVAVGTVTEEVDVTEQEVSDVDEVSEVNEELTEESTTQNSLSVIFVIVCVVCAGIIMMRVSVVKKKKYEE